MDATAFLADLQSAEQTCRDADNQAGADACRVAMELIPKLHMELTIAELALDLCDADRARQVCQCGGVIETKAIEVK